MKYIYEVEIILLISFLGEFLKHIINLPIPASIYGLALMLILLKTKIIPLEKVKSTANFLIEIMPLMFIPAAVGLLTCWNSLKGIWIPIIIITILSTIIVMAVTGRVTQLIITLEKRDK